MQRREFLVGAVSSAAAISGFPIVMRAQKARAADPAKLDRIAIMTLNFSNMLKLPGQPESPQRTLDVFDLPEMYADTYGVHNIEFQHSHIISTEPSYLKELRARMEKVKSRMTNVNLEFGGMNMSTADPVQRQQAIDLTKRWVDHAVIVGCPRVMLNQGQLTDDNKVWAVPTLKTMGDYGRSKGIMISVETRGNGAGGFVARGAAPGAIIPPAPTPPSPPAGVPAAGAGGGRGAALGGRGGAAAAPVVTVTPAWVLLAELIKDSGTYSNVDLGNVGAQNQGELHAALRTLLPMTVGSIHTRVSPVWDLATCLKFMTGNLGYAGLFSIETNGHDAVRNIYNIILDTI